MARIRVKECVPEGGNLVCKFQANGKDIEIVGTLDKEGRPMLSKEFAPKGVDPRAIGEAEKYTLKRVKGEF